MLVINTLLDNNLNLCGAPLQSKTEITQKIGTDGTCCIVDYSSFSSWVYDGIKEINKSWKFWILFSSKSVFNPYTFQNVLILVFILCRCKIWSPTLYIYTHTNQMFEKEVNRENVYT
jgi:hypothetical protein